MTEQNVKNGWYPGGREVIVPASLSRRRSYLSGALSEPGFGCLFYDRTDSGSFCDFPARLYKRYGKSVMFAYDAPYHKSGKVKMVYY